jgi:hypothetical protein
MFLLYPYGYIDFSGKFLQEIREMIDQTDSIIIEDDRYTIKMIAQTDSISIKDDRSINKKNDRL